MKGDLRFQFFKKSLGEICLRILTCLFHHVLLRVGLGYSTGTCIVLALLRKLGAS